MIYISNYIIINFFNINFKDDIFWQTSTVDACRQKAWDLPHMKYTQDFFFQTCTSDSISRARLMAVFTPQAVAWLQVLPISALGLRMDDETIRIAMALRLGLPICTPHTCRQCGIRVDIYVHHGLSCHKNSGKHCNE